ncbi:MAG: DUF4129 domain-containing protein [Nitrososphaerota archaeon]|nr:DUF4129 domain-containing protein [Nitrososphaerota archaeon]
MRSKSVLLLLIVILVAFPIVNFAYAADDTNSGSLSLNQMTTPSGVPQTMISLAHGVNNSTEARLLNQFNAEVQAGNYTAASATLAELKSISRRGSNLPTSLNALIQSTSVGSGGVAVNASQLSNLIASDSNSSGLVGESSTQSYVDINTLANLMSKVDPSLANQLYSQADQLSQAPTTGTIPQQVGGATIPVPSIKTPEINIHPPSSIPTLNAEDIAVPWLIIAGIAVLYFGRKRFSGLLGRQRAPTYESDYDISSFEGLDPNNPKHRIFATFSRMVGVMRSRGVTKLRSETHREFSARCDPRPEKEHIGTISSLYEIARFSRREVTESEASQAESEIGKIEKS